MKKISVLAVSALLTMGIAFSSCDSKKSLGSAKLTSEADSVSYIIGKSQGSGMKKQLEESWPVKGNIDALVAGFMEGINNPDDTLFLGKDFNATNEFVTAFFQKAQQKVADEQKAEGDRFLAENKGKEGVFSTESGLQYKVITQGTGPKPTAEDVVKVHYTGKLLDGTEFDSSVKRGEPAEFPLNRVIPGWSEGVQLMSVGSKYIIWIPSELGYGMNPPQQSGIKQNSALEFEVELLEIVKQ
jgi:FKBP-type peptidyl-prolyl cis-trans isomerase